MMVRHSGVLVLFLWITGCAGAPPMVTACPPVSEIPVSTQAQASAELRAPPPKPALERIMADWIQTRDRLRKCAP
jgi:hypothetical protein